MRKKIADHDGNVAQERDVRRLMTVAQSRGTDAKLVGEDQVALRMEHSDWSQPGAVTPGNAGAEWFRLPHRSRSYRVIFKRPLEHRRRCART